jgi:cytochrome c oxidase subunit 4
MKENNEEQHITSFREHFGTWLALILLTIMTISISIFGADLLSLTVVTALAIASTKALVVGYYFMHLKYDSPLYRIMVGIVMLLFVVFMVLTIFDYVLR